MLPWRTAVRYVCRLEALLLCAFWVSPQPGEKEAGQRPETSARGNSPQLALSNAWGLKVRGLGAQAFKKSLSVSSRRA